MELFIELDALKVHECVMSLPYFFFCFLFTRQTTKPQDASKRKTRSCQFSRPNLFLAIYFGGLILKSMHLNQVSKSLKCIDNRIPILSCIKATWLNNVVKLCI